jgi:peptidoglycan/LPS O-acetylase OafA/YrhL
MTTGRIHFKGLNGIRAIAAMIVVVVHTGQYLSLFGLTPSEYYKWGWQGSAVTLFFVLSGYLITFLLLEEKARTGTVSLKGFYVRRILRIWPLYYLIIVLTLCLGWFFPGTGIPHISAAPLALYTFLLANVAMHFQTVVTPISALWSIGVEEQFYALWPVIIKNSYDARIVLFRVIGVYLLVKAVLIPWDHLAIAQLVSETRIDCMAIGGLGAVILREKGRLLGYIYSPLAQGFCMLLFLYSTLYRPVHIIRTIDQELYAITFMVIILNVSTNPASLVNLEKPIFDFMGKISYGLYVYHLLVIFLLSAATKSLISPRWQWYFFVYTAVVFVTTIMAYVSFRYFEQPFLKLKERYSVVLSQPSAGALSDKEVVPPPSSRIETPSPILPTSTG